jgi:predicted HAD superfamily phosphohydrolase YqeG
MNGNKIKLKKLKKAEGGGYFAFFDNTLIMGDGRTKKEAIKDLYKALNSVLRVNDK